MDNPLAPVPASKLSKSELVHDPGLAGRALFFEGTLLKRIVLLGLPVIVGMLSQTLMNQIDGMFIGRLPEHQAVPGQAAMGPSLILLWAFGGFFSAISVGTQALTARRFGEGDVEGAGKVLTNSVALALGCSIVATAAALALAPTLFALAHDDPDVRRIGVDFTRVRFLGIVPMVLMASYKSFYDGIGKVLVHMGVAIAMNVVNFALCWLFVFGRLGAPALGVQGAAWAAVLASASGTGLMMLWSARPADRRRFRAYRLQNLDGAVAGTIARLSVFSGLATVFVMTGFWLFLKIPALLDKAEGGKVYAAAAWDIIMIMMVVFMTCIAFGTATATLVAQSLGAKKPDLAARYGWQSVLVIVIVMSGVGGLIASFPEALLRLFLPEDAAQHEALKDAVIRAATPSLRFCGGFAPIAAAALVLTQALYGAGESRFVMIAEAFLHFFCLVPLAYVFGVTFGFGLVGCWYATAIYGLALLVATALRFRAGAWQRTVL
jgi:putative MATE family efflux protein